MIKRPIEVITKHEMGIMIISVSSVIADGNPLLIGGGGGGGGEGAPSTPIETLVTTSFRCNLNTDLCSLSGQKE